MYNQLNLEALFKLIGSLPGQNCEVFEDYSHITTLDNAWPNLIFNVNYSNDGVLLGVENLIKLVKDNKLPKTFMGNPQSVDAPVYLALESMKLRSGEWFAMHHDMKTILAPNVSNEMEIHYVKSSEQLNHWYYLVRQVLMQNLPMNRSIIDALYHHQDCYFFVGYINSKIVATSLLFVNDSSAGIYFVATSETQRGKGIGTALTHAAMVKAKKLDCTHIHLQATKSGMPVYKNLGFKEYGVIPLYRLKQTEE